VSGKENERLPINIQDELNELANKAKAALGQTSLTFAFFSDHWQGYTSRNAVDMMKALKMPFLMFVYSILINYTFSNFIVNYYFV